MEVLAVDRLSSHLSVQQDQDDEKKAKQQAYLLVSLARIQAASLERDYLNQQGPPYSGNGPAPQIKLDGLPVLDQNVLPTSPWRRLALSLSAFSSLSGWFASVLLWQKSLNPQAKDLLHLLAVSQSNCKAISSNLAALLGLQDVSSPSPTTLSSVYKQKAAGYMVCKCFSDWLGQAERDLMIVVAETSV